VREAEALFNEKQITTKTEEVLQIVYINIDSRRFPLTAIEREELVCFLIVII